jgi:biotin carboxylase
VAKLVGLPVAVTLFERPDHPAPAARWSVAHTVPVDITDADAVSDAAVEVHGHRPVDAVLSLTEHGLLPAAVAARKLGARGNPVEAVRDTRDKARMRHRLRAHGADTTAWRLCERIDDARDLLAARPGGLVLKPALGAGSAGIATVSGLADLAAAWEWCQAAGAGPVLAEQRLVGDEFSLEAISSGGVHRLLAVTRKETTGPPRFIEVAHSLPADVEDGVRDALWSMARAALDAVGHREGPTHTEMVLQAAGPAVVEINTRVGGDRIWEMVQLGAGVDLVAATVTTLAYGSFDVPVARHARPAAVRFLMPPPGRVTGVSGVAEALATEGVVRVGELPAVGDTIRPPGSSSDRAGYVLGAGPDPAAASAAVARGAARIVIETEPSGPGPGGR